MNRDIDKLMELIGRSLYIKMTASLILSLEFCTK